jgi:hypothetical protein
MNTEPEVVTGWAGVAKAAQWLAEGREVESMRPNGTWGHLLEGLHPNMRYRLKPEPRKPRVWWMILGDNGGVCAIFDEFPDLDRASASAAGMIRVVEDLEWKP